jgi:hypothetical protein
MTNLPEGNLNRGDKSRMVGFGVDYRSMGADGIKRFVGDVQAGMKMPTYNLPVIESVRIHYPGPLSDVSVQGSFGASINPLGANANTPPVGASSVESTFAEPGKFQTNVLILAIGFHLEPDPMAFTIKGNSLSGNAVGAPPQAAGVMPVSADAYNSATDYANNGPAGLITGQTLVPADLEWGWWAERAFFHMTRAYNLVWQFGNRTLIARESLRYTAHTPSSGQEGSASSSEVDVWAYIRQTNAYYRSNIIGPPQPQAIFLPIDRTRVGNMTLGGVTGSSVYRPTRAYETVGVTYGGVGLRAVLRGNSEFRRLSFPLLFRPGVPIGLRADVANSDDQLLMQQWFAASQGFPGFVPASFTADQNIVSGNGVVGTTTIGAEPSLDAAVAAQGITTQSQRVIYKGGTFKITVAIKGFELTDDQASMLSSPDVRSALQSSCGCTIA